MTVSTRGMDAIRRGLPGAIERGVVRGAELIADLARQLAPYDAEASHKHLNESIEVQPGERPTERKVVAGVGLPDARAAYQEYGTTDQPAQPYMTPAAEQIDVEAEVADEVRRLVRGAT